MTPPRGKRRRLKLRDPLAYERRFWSEDVEWIAGVDEVGRGPLAGPVVAAAVVLPRDLHLDDVQDSKLLTGEQRLEMDREIRARAVAVGVGAASNREVDRRRITGATRLALRRALEDLGLRPGHVVIDGRPVKELGWEHDAQVKADYRIHCVSCASVVAKVLRDRIMDLLDPRYPEYGWCQNRGYGTAEHREAIQRVGVSPHHRLSFGGVQPELPLS